MEQINNRKWCAIGDSFTYLNDHLDETGNRLTKGYLTQTCELLPQLEVMNLGINGSNTRDWLTKEIPQADLYTILLGTNDWFHKIPVGDREDYRLRKTGTIVGNLGDLVERIHKVNPMAPIIVMNPVERADFVYIFDYDNKAPGSYEPYAGQWLKDVSKQIYESCIEEGVYPLDLHTLCGFNQNNVIRFKRVKMNGNYENLPYPDYVGVPFDPKIDEYPYPLDSVALTYDGLHPTDEGFAIIARILADKIQEVLNHNNE